jgi:predicted nuclease with TOPRIM domain
MQEQIQARLEELKKELEAGQAELQKVDMQRTYLHETVLRISGAVQVLEELLSEKQSAGNNADGHDESHPATIQAKEADVHQSNA